MLIESRCKLTRDHIGRYALIAAFYLCIVGAAIGASKMMEGPDETQNASQGYEAQSFQMEVQTFKATARATRPSPTEEAVDVEPTGEPASVSIPTPMPPVRDVVCTYPWDCATAMRIVDCETGGTWDPNAVGNSGERGWFQIASVHWDKPQCDPVRLFDPVYNTACAYFVYAGDAETPGQGWNPWSCY